MSFTASLVFDATISKGKEAYSYYDFLYPCLTHVETFLTSFPKFNFIRLGWAQ